MITLLTGLSVCRPENTGTQDILLLDGKIGAIGEGLRIDTGGAIEVRVIDGAGKIAVPGFIDSHVHMLGGGGEGGYRTRTPEIMLTALTTAGVTTAVGCLGTDSVTRDMMALAAKARALEEEGLTTYIYTGSYQIPVKTLTGSIAKDMAAIDKVIGVGEIALSDHRSSQPTYEEFVKTAAEARVGGMLSGKAGIVDIHVGDGDRGIEMLMRVIAESEIPVAQFLPTHVNRNRALFETCLAFARKGGCIDLTAREEADSHGSPSDEVGLGEAMGWILREGLGENCLTMSSDAQGSLPLFNSEKECVGMGIGAAGRLLEEIRESVLVNQIPLEKAIKTVTENPARILKLKNKGRLEQGFDADLCLLDKDTLELDTVIAKGRLMVMDKKPVVFGTFEKR